jgi:hypothetical protein
MPRPVPGKGSNSGKVSASNRRQDAAMAARGRGKNTTPTKTVKIDGKTYTQASARSMVAKQGKVQEAGIPLALLAVMGARAAGPVARRLLQSRKNPPAQKPPYRSLKEAARAGDAKAKKPGKPPASRPMMTTVDGRRVSDSPTNRAMDAAVKALRKGDVKSAQKNLDIAAGRPKYGKGTYGKK